MGMTGIARWELQRLSVHMIAEAMHASLSHGSNVFGWKHARLDDTIGQTKLPTWVTDSPSFWIALRVSE